MSEYYAEHESIEEVSVRLKEGSSALETCATEIDASRKKIEQSKTLAAYGYANLINRSRMGVTLLSRRESKIASVLETVSALYADYESQVISALEESTSAGNNYSATSRHQARDESESHSTTTGTNQGQTSGITDYTNPTPEQKRQYALDWLERTHPELLEQIYDRLHSDTTGMTATGAVSAGIAAAASIAGSGTSASTTGSTGTTSTGTTSTTSTTGTTGTTSTATKSTGTTSTGITGTTDTTGSTGTTGTTGTTGGTGTTGTGTTGTTGTSQDSDWVADMLNDAVDSDAAQAAQGTLAEAASVTNPEATASGADALSDSSSVSFATDDSSSFSSILSGLGERLVEAVRTYGVNAGVIASGAGAVYASSGVAIEAVAHCAEFVTTRCVPGVRGFMDSVTSVVRVTRVNIRVAVGNIVQGVSSLAG